MTLARPYQRIWGNPAALARVTGIARLVLHAARRTDDLTARSPAEVTAADAIRNRADAIAQTALGKDRGHG